MKELILILYSRKGCCLCEGLEQRLESLTLAKISPSLILKVIDIDDGMTSPDIRARYDQHVPVMVLHLLDLNQMLELPRVSPRLQGDGLFQWLQKFLIKKTGPD